ncbi:MAG TPA: hypothetical protein VFU02_25360 [Polyangiaceae bacterium]|nr:hypothetical protein [Polyangiaceae bacterium]
MAADPASEQKAHGAYTHDGFFMRFASGFGVYDEFARSETDERYGGRVNVRARGFAVAGEFSMGGTPYPGLVIGGGLFEVGVVTSSVTTNRDDDPNIEVADDLEIESRDLTIIGVFADRYFVPTLGLHVQAALGVAQQIGVSVDALEDKEIYDPWGPGMVLGIGYEMWLTEQWSLGVLARVGASLLFGEDRTGVQWVHYIASWPSFLMTVTYH